MSVCQQLSLLYIIVSLKVYNNNTSLFLQNISIYCILEKSMKLFITVERDPKKRRVKPVESAQQSLLDFDLGESSDDSDFRIEDHCEESDDDSVDSNDVGKGKLWYHLCSAYKIVF